METTFYMILVVVNLSLRQLKIDQLVCSKGFASILSKIRQEIQQQTSGVQSGCSDQK
jgi:hypothetical protein